MGYNVWYLLLFRDGVGGAGGGPPPAGGDPVGHSGQAHPHR